MWGGCRKSPASCRRCTACRRAACLRHAVRAPTTSARPNIRPMRRSAADTGRRAGTPTQRRIVPMADVAQTPVAAKRPPVLEIEGLKKHFPIKKGFLRRTHGHVLAVDGVSFTIGAGEALR